MPAAEQQHPGWEERRRGVWDWLGCHHCGRVFAEDELMYRAGPGRPWTCGECW